MSDTVKTRIKVGIMEETTEGVYAAPSSASKFVSPLADGLEISPSKELLSRNNLNNSIGQVTPRTGTKSVSGTIPVEAKAQGVAGAEPQFAPLLRAALGASRQNTTVITTKASGNTASILQINDADIAKLNIGDCIQVMQAGAHHVSPIIAKTTTSGSATVTMLVPHPSGDCSDSVQIQKLSTYMTANSGHPTLSISKYVEDAVLEYAAGCRVKNMSLNNFSTGQLADFKFQVEGLSFGRSLTAPPFSPTYDPALPPIVLGATVYMDGAPIEVNEVAFSVENTLAFKTSTGSSNGKIKSRISKRSVTGSFNPYKQDDSISNFSKFDNNTEFSLFGFMANPTATPGEFDGVVAFYMPKCIMTEISEAEKDGLLQEAISFQAARGSDGASEELYISII